MESKKKLREDFVSKEHSNYRFQIGKGGTASALAGFVAGCVVTTVVFTIILWYMGQLTDVLFRFGF